MAQRSLTRGAYEAVGRRATGTKACPRMKLIVIIRFEEEGVDASPRIFNMMTANTE